MTDLIPLPKEAFNHYSSITPAQIEQYKNDGFDLSTQEPESGYTLLIMTAWHGNEGVVKTLIEHGVGLDTIDELGETALLSAIRQGHYEIADHLCEAGANPFIRDNKGQTALDHVLTKEKDKRSYKSLKALETAMAQYNRYSLESETSVSTSRFYKVSRTCVTSIYDFSTEEVITETAAAKKAPSYNIRSFNNVADTRGLEQARKALTALGGKIPNDKAHPARLTIRTKGLVSG